ncbi:hypothetical protein, partial [Enterococcus faecium]
KNGVVFKRRMQKMDIESSNLKNTSFFKFDEVEKIKKSVPVSLQIGGTLNNKVLRKLYLNLL